jgi:hypothetical protein
MLHSWRIKTGELSDELGLSLGLVWSILTKDLGMKCISVKSVPKLLIVEQKETRLAVARDLLQCAGQEANYLKTLPAMNLGSMGMTQKQKPLRPIKQAKFGAKVKMMLIAFFNHQGIVHQKYASDGQTVNMKYTSKLSSAEQATCIVEAR